MGIGPLEFLDGAFHDKRFLGIEHGKRMMCHGRNRTHGYSDAREADCFEFHGASPSVYLAFSLRRTGHPPSISQLAEICNGECYACLPNANASRAARGAPTMRQ